MASRFRLIDRTHTHSEQDRHTIQGSIYVPNINISPCSSSHLVWIGEQTEIVVREFDNKQRVFIFPEIVVEKLSLFLIKRDCVSQI